MNPQQESSEQEPNPVRALPPEQVDQTREGARLHKIEDERIQRGQTESAQQEAKAIEERTKAENDRKKASAKKG